jgi:hypothetical protein
LPIPGCWGEPHGRSIRPSSRGGAGSAYHSAAPKRTRSRAVAHDFLINTFSSERAPSIPYSRWTLVFGLDAVEVAASADEAVRMLYEQLAVELLDSGKSMIRGGASRDDVQRSVAVQAPVLDGAVIGPARAPDYGQNQWFGKFANVLKQYG